MSMRTIIGGSDRFSFVERKSGKMATERCSLPSSKITRPSTFSPTPLRLVTFPLIDFLSRSFLPSRWRAPWVGNLTRHGLLIPVGDPGLVTVLH